MKKNKKIYLKKIVAVLVLASVLSSLFLVTSSASNASVYGTNYHVVPFFNPVGFTIKNMYENEVAGYNYSFGSDFYAEFNTTSDFRFGFPSRTSFYDDGVKLWRNLDRYNDVTFYFNNGSFSYVTWGAQFYQESVDTCMYRPYQTWHFSDFVFKKDFDYKLPFLDITMDSSLYVADFAEYYYNFTYHYFDVNSDSFKSSDYTLVLPGNIPQVPVLANSFRVPLVDRVILNQLAALHNTDYLYISNYSCTFRHPFTTTGDTSDSRVSRVFIGGLIDDFGSYPSIEEYDSYNLELIESLNELPDNADVSEWIVSGVKGFMDTPLFGPLSIGMIFLSIFGFWFLIMFLKKFAGG